MTYALFELPDAHFVEVVQSHSAASCGQVVISDAHPSPPAKTGPPRFAVSPTGLTIRFE